MYRSGLHTVTFSIIILGLSLHAYEKGQLAIDLQCEVAVRRVDSKPIHLVHAFLVNKSDAPIIVLAEVPCRWLETSGPDDPLVVRYELEWDKDIKRRKVPSEAGLKPVTLLPGERTELILNIAPGQLIGKKYLKIEYVVAQQWGERWKVWSGTVMSKIVPIPPLA
jgi:hypothetical protein